MSGQFQSFHDSDERTNWYSLFTAGFSPFLPENVERVYASGGFIELQEDGSEDISGEEFSIGTDIRLFEDYSLSGKLRFRSLSEADDTTDVWLQGNYAVENHLVSLRMSYEDVETASALAKGIEVGTSAGAYRLRFSRWWHVLADLSYWDDDDGNSRFNAIASPAFQLPAWREWEVGATYRYSDTEFESPFYYTPEELNLGMGTVAYRYKHDEEWFLDLEGGVGGGYDRRRGARVVGRGAGRITRVWFSNLRTSLEVGFLSNPDYQSVFVQLQLDYRF
jgi:hypothetical protein